MYCPLDGNQQRKFPGACFLLRPLRVPSKYTDLSLHHFYFSRRENRYYHSPTNNLSIQSATQMHAVTSPLLQQGWLPFPLCIPTQSCFVQCSVPQNASVFGLKELCCFERLWAILTICLCFELQKFCNAFIYL